MLICNTHRFNQMQFLIRLKGIILCAFLLLPAFPVSGEISFVHIGSEQGLSQSTVLSIRQDKKGNMWFATYDGLNRYDGYTVTVYRHDEEDSLSIASDIIRVVEIDVKGRLWIGTYNGLSLYDPDLDTFRNFTFPCGDKPAEVRGIAPMDNDMLLLDTSAGLLFFNPSSGCLSDRKFPVSLEGDMVTAICRQNDAVFVGTLNGRLLRLSSDGRSAEDISHPVLSGKRVQSIFMENYPLIYIGTEGDGLYRIDLANGRATSFSKASGDLSSDYVRAICSDTYGNLWVGTFSALNVMDKVTGRFSSHVSNPASEGSLSQSSVRAIFKDAQGGMWVGTWFGGLNYWHPLLRRFSSIRSIPYHNSLNDNVVSCIIEDSSGQMWIGTNSGGVNRFDPETGKFSFYTMDDGLWSNDIKTLYMEGGKIYVGSHLGGLGIIDAASGRIRQLDIGAGNAYGNIPYQDRSIYSIIPYQDRSILLGMVGGYVWRFSPGSEKSRPMTDASTGRPVNVGPLVSMKADSQGRIWIGTESGIRVYRGTGDTLTRLDILPPNPGLDRTFVNCIAECAGGKFWLGTRNGLYCFDESDGILAHYTVKDGLPNNVVYGILEDDAGNLWISSGMGLSRFDQSSRSFRNYTSADGLQDNQFCLYSYCRTSGGEMYFGGIKGITTFNPASLPDNPFIPAVSITELSVSNTRIRPGDESGILASDISKTEEIHLKEGNSSFALTFAVTDYISWKQNVFAYRLENYEDEWNYVMNPERTVSYTNLPPGKYRFYVTASNKDGIWNEKPAELSITIHPHWYNTTWARLLFALVFTVLAGSVARYLWIRKKMKMQLAFEKVDKERIRELNEMKLRFFINISHELRTPLTMIVAPLQDLLGKVNDKWIQGKLRHIGKSTERLLYLVNQLMDYRRAELGVFHLKVRKAEIHPLLVDTFNYYRQLAASEKIDYRLESSLEGTELYFDRKYVEIILNNLLSNAFKYTPAGQSITLSARMDGEMCLLQVIDTGQGIAPEKQSLVFERFYQVDQDHVGSGIGLGLVKNLAEMHHGHVGLESELGKGSTFSVWLPAGRQAYSENEISSASDEEQIYSSNPAEFHVLNASHYDIEDKDVPEDEGKTEATEEETSDRKATVLIAEDNSEIREYLSEGLAPKYRIITAENGQDALEKMKDELPDIILTDVMMPIMDGLKLCRNVKQNLQTSHIPVLILSAKADVKWQMSGLYVGADDYIPKPFSMSVVEAKIGNILRTRLSTIEHFSKASRIEPEQMALNKLDENFLKKAVEEVEKHIDDSSFSADQFAERMNMSRSNLHIKMKALTGSSAMDFIRKIRFSKACELLKDGRYSIADISAMVGFGSPAYFATSFKKYVGCLPSEYMKKSD